MEAQKNLPASTAVPIDARCKAIFLDVHFSLFLKGSGTAKSRIRPSNSSIDLYSSPGLEIASSTGTKNS